MRAAVLIIVIALAAACGDASPRLAETSTDRLELEVVPAPDPLVSGQEATFELHVTNTSDRRALLTFDTTQRGDVALSTGDVEVYRWAARRVFAQEPHEVAFAPGQTVRFPLEEEPLPVAPGDYELMATVTGVPKLRTIRTALSVVGSAATEAPSPRPTDPPELPPAYEQLTSAVTTTVDELALPLASALTDGDAFAADAAVVRQEVADAFTRLTFAELLLAYQVVADGDVDGARAFAESVAEHAAVSIGRLRSVEPVDRRDLARLLTEHVGIVADYAAVVDAGGGAALDAPRAELEQIAAGLGPLVAVTAGGVIGSDAATELFGAWSDAVAEAIRDGGQGGAATVEQAHAAAAEAVDPVALEVAQAYVEHLDLDGFETTAALVRQELTTQLTDEVFLLATAVDVGALEQAAVSDVLDENADELAEAVGRAPAIDASEEAALLELWRRRDAALLDAAAAPDAEPDELARIDDEIARALADATDGELAAQQVGDWLAAQRRALLDALGGLAA